MAHRKMAQDGPALVKVSEQLETLAGEFDRLRDEFYREIDTNLGTSDEVSKPWYGMRASSAKVNAKGYEQSFIDLATEIRTLAQNVNEDATTWGTVDSANG